MVQVLADYDGFGLVAASPQAERVIGAAMMLAPTLHGDSTGPSVIFDVNFASGTLLARAAQRLRNNGNQSRLIGLVLNPLIETNEPFEISGLDHVVIGPYYLTSSRQQSQGCISRIAVPSLS